MRTKFNWQSGEEEWERGPQEEETPAPKDPLWPRFLGFLLLLVLVGAIFFFQLRQKKVSAPVPLPSQLIELTCHTERPGELVNYWYDPRRGRWLDGPQLPEGYDQSRVTALDENSFLVEKTTYEQDGPRWRLSLWEDDALSFLAETAVQRPRALSVIDPTRRKLVFTEFIGSSGLYRYYLLDLDACQSGECRMVSLPGPVIWSPDGQRTLISIQNDSGFSLFLGNAAAMPEHNIGAGLGRNWIDSERFIYQSFDQPENDEMRWVVENIAGETLAVLNTADLDTIFLPDYPNLSPHWFNKVEPNPVVPDELLVTVNGDDSQGSERVGAILRYDWRTGEYERLFVTPDAFPESQISPDGRWLAIHEIRLPEFPENTVLLLFDLATGGQKTIDEGDIFSLSGIWSEDGRWLLSLHSDLLYLLIPDDDFQQVVLPPTGPCIIARWISGE
ncbi:MAG: hypothetical protein WAM60_07540 [Candidatus Promineifilaceae bacterium]